MGSFNGFFDFTYQKRYILQIEAGGIFIDHEDKMVYSF